MAATGNENNTRTRKWLAEKSAEIARLQEANTQLTQELEQAKANAQAAAAVAAPVDPALAEELESIKKEKAGVPSSYR